MGGDLSIPAVDEDVEELARRWVREFARAAKMPLWEPMLASAATGNESR